MTEAIYEQIGRKYRSTRHADPRISKEIRQALGDTESIVKDSSFGSRFRAMSWPAASLERLEAIKAQADSEA